VDCGAPVPPDATIIKAQGGKPLKEHATLYTVGTLARSTLNTSSRLDDCESRASPSLRAEVLQRTGMLIAVGGPCCPRRVFAEFGFIVAHPGIWVYANMGGAGAGACAMWGCGWRIPMAYLFPLDLHRPGGGTMLPLPLTVGTQVHTHGTHVNTSMQHSRALRA
jgi:hypothetical protein